MKIDKFYILLKNNLVYIDLKKSDEPVSKIHLGTLISNLTYYGYSPSKDLLKHLSKLSTKSLESWWSASEPYLKEITGSNKKMKDFVVYKNFPREVLEMSDAEYWIKQIFMYLGLPSDLFTEEEVERDLIFERLQLKVLHKADNDSLRKVCYELLNSPSRWTDEQFVFVKYLVLKEEIPCDASSIYFKENMVKIVAELIENNIPVKLNSATDVIRLAVGMSDGDVSFKTNTKFRKFSRKERRFFVDLLSSCNNIEEDMGRRKGQWKKFIKAIHPGDYSDKNTKLMIACNNLYHNALRTFNSNIEILLDIKDPNVLYLMEERPGDFLRRLHHSIDCFGIDAVDMFISVLPKLSLVQLLKITKYIEHANVCKYRMFPPRGDWSKVKVVDNNRRINVEFQNKLLTNLNKEIAERVYKHYDLINLDMDVMGVKIKTNDSELSDYGRGTVFPLPEGIEFIRTASYWQTKNSCGNTWFDNSWNFFDSKWNPVGECCWISNEFIDKKSSEKLSIFSGDPTNSNQIDGKACQMIDLYLDKLEKANVRYAVWSILSYNKIAFSDTYEVFATMQWGESAQKGELFEPSRCQMAFPVNGGSMAKYIAYVDIKERKVYYMDANFSSDVSSATNNNKRLQILMPAFVEYLNSIPSVYDVFKGIPKSKKGTPIFYSDAGIKIKDGDAFVFKPTNESNKFNQIDINALLVN